MYYRIIIVLSNLVDVELSQSGVEHEIEIVKHRHDLHRRAFAGQCCERHNVGEINRRLRKQLRVYVLTSFKLLSHAPINRIKPSLHMKELSDAVLLNIDNNNLNTGIWYSLYSPTGGRRNM